MLLNIVSSMWVQLLDYKRIPFHCHYCHGCSHSKAQCSLKFRDNVVVLNLEERQGMRKPIASMGINIQVGTSSQGMKATTSLNVCLMKL